MREQFRCVMHKTEEIDRSAPPSASNPDELELLPQGLNVCHIVPFSLNSFASHDGEAIVSGHACNCLWCPC